MRQAQIGQDIGCSKFGGQFFDCQGLAGEAFGEVSIEPMLRACGMRGLVEISPDVSDRIAEDIEVRQKDVVEIDAVVCGIGAKGNGDAERTDEGIGMRDSFRVRQDWSSGRREALDLGAVEDREGAREETSLGVLIVADGIIVTVGCKFLPEHDGRCAFALADLGVKRLPLPVCAPGAASKAVSLSCDPKSERIDAAIGLSGRDVGWASNRASIVVPGIDRVTELS
ncbi:hypothetical protein MesoLjLa_68490 (plasmid) [Mesorhizobium sp. L-2-11]|nr:hypothetical protein MesoLjLa_68490 [Mesorhizobium sp. L-2-11]